MHEQFGVPAQRRLPRRRPVLCVWAAISPRLTWSSSGKAAGEARSGEGCSGWSAATYDAASGVLAGRGPR